MGEYVESNKYGSFKAGTCEDLYYVTLDSFSRLYKSRDISAQDWAYYTKPGAFRFRFPFPDEKIVLPSQPVDAKTGVNAAYNRCLFFVGNGGRQWAIPPQEHGPMRYSTGQPLNFNANIPCPLGEKSDNWPWVNSYADSMPIGICQQKIVADDDDQIVVATIVQCPYCKEKWRLSKENGLQLAQDMKSQFPAMSDLIIHGYTNKWEDTLMK